MFSAFREMHNISELKQHIPFDWNIFNSSHLLLYRYHLDSSFRDYLLVVLDLIFDSIIINSGDFPWNIFHYSLFMIFYDLFNFRDQFSSWPFFIFNYFCLIRYVSDSALSQ